MLRTALTPKWLGLLCLVMAVMVGFGVLGRWQLDVARERGVVEATERAAAQPVTPLTTLMAPDGRFPADGLDRRVTVAGTYDAARQVLVTSRRLGERAGYWVVTPLAVEGVTGRTRGPALIPVLRGFVEDPTDAPAPPGGRVAISGTLAQSEPPPNEFRPLPAGQVRTLNVPALINLWGADMYNAFVFLDTQDPPVTGLAHVSPPPPGVAELNWRNLGYALQWFFFGAFALYMWWRMVREDARAQAAARAGRDSAPMEPVPTTPAEPVLTTPAEPVLTTPAEPVLITPAVPSRPAVRLDQGDSA